MIRLACLGLCGATFFLAGAAAAPGGTVEFRAGNATGAEHVAFVRASVPGGVWVRLDAGASRVFCIDRH
jgi:hypothetical protein